ncbi:MAG: hypothetical protein RLZZ226_1832 [Pseudomonadota bacterium]
MLRGQGLFDPLAGGGQAGQQAIKAQARIRALRTAVSPGQPVTNPVKTMGLFFQFEQQITTALFAGF